MGLVEGCTQAAVGIAQPPIKMKGRLGTSEDRGLSHHDPALDLKFSNTSKALVSLLMLQDCQIMRQTSSYALHMSMLLHLSDHTRLFHMSHHVTAGSHHTEMSEHVPDHWTAHTSKSDAHMYISYFRFTVTCM